jgi:hypothetical protein
MQQLMGILRRQHTAYMSQNGHFTNGIWASRKTGAYVNFALLIANGWLPGGSWRKFGSDAPELSRVATRVHTMVPSSCTA